MSRLESKWCSTGQKFLQCLLLQMKLVHHAEATLGAALPTPPEQSPAPTLTLVACRLYKSPGWASSTRWAFCLTPCSKASAHFYKNHFGVMIRVSDWWWIKTDTNPLSHKANQITLGQLSILNTQTAT